MKLQITHTFENVDEEWLTWWFETQGPSLKVYQRDQLPWTVSDKNTVTRVNTVTTIELKDDAT